MASNTDNNINPQGGISQMQIENEELEEAIMHNMIEEFMNISDEDNKIFNLLKEEFKDWRIWHYGSLCFIQNDDNIENIPNISELLHIYEEIFSNLNMKSAICLKLEKYYVIYNDGFVTIGNNGMGKKVFIYKIKTIIVILHINDSQKAGGYNYRILKVWKQIKYI